MIELIQAEKRFGRVRALDDVSFALKPGTITGLLGINGAGKSTTLKAIAGLLHLDRGAVAIDGSAPSAATKRQTAYLPEIDVWYPWMTIADAIAYVRDFYPDWDERKAAGLMDYFQLRPEMKINQISKGQRAKAKLLLALSRRAAYLLLDEPLSGIDVIAREQLIQGLVEDFAEEGQTILITTHEVKEVESMLDEVIFIRNGRIALHGNVETLRMERGQSLVDMMKELYAHEIL